MLWSMAKTPRAYTQQSTRTSASICTLAFPQPTPNSMYKPTPYLALQSCPYQLELLRIRTQHTTHVVPSQLHYAFQHACADYIDAVCSHCLTTGTTVLGDKLHIICHCPATKVVLEKFIDKFQRITRLLYLPPITSFTPDQMTRLVLGNPPPPVLNKSLKGWDYRSHPHLWWVGIRPGRSTKKKTDEVNQK